MKMREWIQGGVAAYELYEYKNLGVLKNYTSSFSSNVDHSIEKTRNESGIIIFSSHLDRRKGNPFIYVNVLEAGIFGVSFYLVLRFSHSLQEHY